MKITVFPYINKRKYFLNNSVYDSDKYIITKTKSNKKCALSLWTKLYHFMEICWGRSTHYFKIAKIWIIERSNSIISLSRQPYYYVSLQHSFLCFKNIYSLTYPVYITLHPFFKTLPNIMSISLCIYSL